MILSCFGFLFVVLQFLLLSLAEAQTYNKIEFVYNIEQMKGHLEQAVVNKEKCKQYINPGPYSTSNSRNL